MAGLPSTPPKNTYKGILKTSDNGNISSSEKQITDGDGNNVGAKATSSKWIMNQAKVENAPSTSSELTALLIDSNGDILSRVLDASAFTGAVSTINRATARTSTLNYSSGGSLVALTFKSSGSGANDSYVQGSGFTIGSDSVDLDGSIAAGSIVKVTANVEAAYDANIVSNHVALEIQLLQNSTVLKTYVEDLSNDVLPGDLAASNVRKTFTFFDTVHTIDANDTFSIKLAFHNAGGVTTTDILEDSILEVEYIS